MLQPLVYNRILYFFRKVGQMVFALDVDVVAVGSFIAPMSMCRVIAKFVCL